jgi:hypothetical protein
METAMSLQLHRDVLLTNKCRLLSSLFVSVISGVSMMIWNLWITCVISSRFLEHFLRDIAMHNTNKNFHSPVFKIYFNVIFPPMGHTVT